MRRGMNEQRALLSIKGKDITPSSSYVHARLWCLQNELLPKDKEETDYFDSGGNVRKALNFEISTHAREREKE